MTRTAISGRSPGIHTGAFRIERDHLVDIASGGQSGPDNGRLDSEVAGSQPRLPAPWPRLCRTAMVRLSARDMSMLLNADPARAFMPYPAVPVPNAEAGPLAGLTFAVKDLF